MNLSGLAPENAPTADAPLGLFYLMPVFLTLAGALVWVAGGDVMASRWTPAALATTHLIVLGALAPVMCGALLQISPVLLGASFPRVQLISRLTSAGLAGGSLTLAAGFLWQIPALLAAGGLCAAAGLSVFILGAVHALASGSGPGEPLRAVRLAVTALGITFILGLALVLARLGLLHLPQHLRWVDAHAAWGISGWIGLLVVAIGTELIPMFFVAPAFPPVLRRWLPAATFVVLASATIGYLLPQSTLSASGLVAVLFSVYLLYTAVALLLEQRRQRPHRDATLWLWQLSHLGVFGAAIAWLSGANASTIGALLLGSALSFTIGSLVKIVPFLSWLDLQQRRQRSGNTTVTLPRLRVLLPERRATAIAVTLIAGISLIAVGTPRPELAQLGGVLLFLCGTLLGYALLQAGRMRRAVMRQLGGAA